MNCEFPIHRGNQLRNVESVANFLFLEEIVFTEHVRFSYSGLIEEIFELLKLIV